MDEDNFQKRGEQWILFSENLNVCQDEVEGNIEAMSTLYRIAFRADMKKNTSA